MNCPQVHCTHALAAEAPVKAENVPAEHDVHVEELVAADATEKVPALQSWHTVAPAAVENFPAGHALQVDPDRR